MLNKILSALILMWLSLMGIPGKPAGEVSFIEDINLTYEDEKWICGDVECPGNTFGCKILKQTDATEKDILNIMYTCFDEDKVGLLSAADSIKMSKNRRIDIEIESYVGAESTFSTSYGTGGHESANGVVAPDNWEHFKQTAANNKQTMDNFESQLQ